MFNQNRSFGPRPEPVKGNWKCTECQAEITELPFNPDPDRKIYCKDCWRKNNQNRFSR